MSVSQRKPWTAGIWTKLNRAEHHLADLDARVGSYLDADPYGFYINEYRNNVHEIVLTVKTPPPLKLSAIIGDCLQNLRAALDHLAWELVIAHGLTPSVEPPRTQFPIYTSNLTPKGNPRVVGVPPGVDPRAQSIIEGLQPYHRRDDPNAHPLAILQNLSNEDKHRTLHLTVAQLVNTEVYLVTPSGERWGGQHTAGVVHDEEPLGAFAFPPGATMPEDWEVQGVGASFVAFFEVGPWEDRPVILVLDDLLEYIRNIVVGGLQPFIDQSRDS